MNSKHNLAGLFKDQEKYDRAEPLFQQVLYARTAQLGANHPTTLTSKHNLASLYTAMENYPAAEQYYIRALAGFEAISPPLNCTTGGR